MPTVQDFRDALHDLHGDVNLAVDAMAQDNLHKAANALSTTGSKYAKCVRILSALIEDT